MRKVFHDQSLQDHFERNGFVKVQLLDTTQIESLTQLYLDLTLDNSPNGFFSTLGETTSRKKLLHEFFTKHFSGILTTVLFNYKMVSSNFITKKSTESKIAYHQDWAFIDESAGKCSVNIWCPLVATFHENGNLAVVPGFHQLGHQLRTSNSNYSPYGHCQEYFKSVAVELPTAAGEAIIYDNALVHGSTPNLCGTNRLTASILAIPGEEQIVIHHLSADNIHINLYKVNDDYLLDNNPFADVPAQEFLYKKVAFEPVENPLEELRQLNNRLQKVDSKNKSKAGFLGKFFTNFK